jgi:hypothetical protein
MNFRPSGDCAHVGRQKEFFMYYKWEPKKGVALNSRSYIEKLDKPPIPWYKSKEAWYYDFQKIYKKRNLTVESISGILQENNLTYCAYQLKNLDKLRHYRRLESIKTRQKNRENRLYDYSHLSKYQIKAKYDISRTTIWRDLAELKKRAEQGKLQAGINNLLDKLNRREFIIERLQYNHYDFDRLVNTDKGYLRHIKCLFKKFNLTVKQVYDYKNILLYINSTNETVSAIKYMEWQLDEWEWQETIGQSDLTEKIREMRAEYITKLNIWKLINALSNK